MDKIAFRQATKEDAHKVLSIMAQAFEKTPGSEKYVRDKERIAKDIDAHWVLAQGKKIVGAVQRALRLQVSGSDHKGRGLRCSLGGVSEHGALPERAVPTKMWHDFLLIRADGLRLKQYPDNLHLALQAKPPIT